MVGHPRVQRCAAGASLLCLAFFACFLPDCTCCTPCPLGPPGTSWPPHDVSWPCCTPALVALCPSTVMLPLQRGAAQGWSLLSCHSPSFQALWHTAGLGRTQAGKRAVLSPHPCCQHSMGLTAKQVTAHAPLGTGMGLLFPQTAGKASILPPRDSATCQALGCSRGLVLPQALLTSFPKVKEELEQGYQSWGLTASPPDSGHILPPCFLWVP